MAGIQDYIGYLYNANIDTLILYIIIHTYIHTYIHAHTHTYIYIERERHYICPLQDG